MEDKDINLDP